MGESMSDDSAQDAASLIRQMEQCRGMHCSGCGRVVSFHEVLMCIAIGFRNQPLCLPCLAGTLEQDPARLRDQLMDYIRQRECFSEAWNWANQQAGLGEGEIPPGQMK